MSITQPGLVDKTTNLVNADTFIVFENASGLNKEMGYNTLISSITATLDPASQAQLSSAVASLTALISSSITTTLQNKVWPVGSHWDSATSNTNPNSILGFGTWVLDGGYVAVGWVSGDSDFGTIGQSGGAKTHNHGGVVGSTALTEAQIPTHSHAHKDRFIHETTGASVTAPGTEVGITSTSGTAQSNTIATGVYGYILENTQSAGGSGAHNHTITSASSLMPYKVFYRWIRTA